MTGDVRYEFPPEPLEEAEPLPKRKSYFQVFAALEFRLLSVGLFFANLGYWMQLTAIAYLIVRLAHNAAEATLWLGYFALAWALPALLLFPVGAVVAEVFPRRTVLWSTNAVTAVCAIFLTAISESNLVSLWALLTATALTAAARGVDAPARQSWVPQLVEAEFAQQAIGLSTLLCNGAGIIGPILAALVLERFDAAVLFVVSAISILIEVAAATLMKPARNPSSRRAPMVAALGEGLSYVVTHKILRLLLIGGLASGFLVRPYLLVLPAFALSVLQTSPAGLALLYIFGGCGIVAGAFGSAYVGNGPYRVRIWGGGAAIFSLSIILFAQAPDLIDSLPWMMLASAALMVMIGSANIIMHTLVPEKLRGRAVAVYSLLLLIAAPLGALGDGLLAAGMGLRGAEILGATVFFLIIAVIQYCM